MSNPVGRPPKFSSPDDFLQRATAYFDSTPFEEWTITGVALACGTFRDVLMDYQNKDEFSSAIKWAKQQVQHSYEMGLRKNGRAGDIFGLKNFGWRDKVEVDNTISGTLATVDVDAETALAFTEYLKTHTLGK